MYNPLQKDRLGKVSEEFKNFAAQMVPLMRKLQKLIYAHMQNYSQGMTNGKTFLHILDKYEDLNMNNYADIWEEKNEYLVFTTQKEAEAEVKKDEQAADAEKQEQPETDEAGPTPEKLKENVEKMADGLKNPFFYLYHWCEGELFDLQSVTSAVAQMDRQLALVKKNEKSKKSAESEITAAKQGRKTVKTIFKGKDDTNVDKMDAKVESTLVEIEKLTQLHAMQTVYLGEKIIPEFR